MKHDFSHLSREKWQGCPGYVAGTCTSTMDLAWDLTDNDLFPEYAWVLAHTQTRGRGRLDREWVCRDGNLFVTMRLPDSAETLGNLLSLAMALPLVRTLESLNVPARIKWPNDIMVGSTKVGGILIEQKQKKIMAGIGFNIEAAPESSPREKFFHVQAGCLKKSGVDLNSSKLWHLFLKHIIYQLPGMISDPSRIDEAVEAFLAWKGESVVLENTDTYNGPARILGIDSKGRLCIRTSQGISFVSSGRIIPRVV